MSATHENANCDVVRVPYNAITRPLAPERPDGIRSGFVADQELAKLLFGQRIRRVGRGMVICDGQLYDLREAVQVVKSLRGGDPYGLVDQVETLAELTRAGATHGRTNMQLGSATYAITRGVIAEPCTSPSAMAG